LRVLLTLLAALVAACSQPSSVQTLSPSEFRDAVAAEISKKHPGLCIEKPDASTIRIGRDRKHCSDATVSTTYVYGQYRGDPGGLQTYVGGLAGVASTAIEAAGDRAFQPDPASLVAAVRPAAYVKQLRNADGSEGTLWRPFVGDLIGVLMQDSPEQMRSIGREDLKTLGLTEAAAWDLALKNLRAKIGPLQRSTNDQGAEAVSADSGLATSTLWLPETCRSGGPNFDAFVVARDTYLYADQRSPKAMAMLAGYAADLLKSGEPTFSDTLISCIEGQWHASVFDGANTWRPAERGVR
jgi:hypothetical protein